MARLALLERAQAVGFKKKALRATPAGDHSD